MEKTMSSKTMRLVFGGVMIALATVLSMIKVYDLPFGGSITLCSMLPILFYGYKFGLKWGFFAGFIYGLLQLMLGTGALKGLDALSLAGVLIFDFLLAFSVLGTACIFKNKIKNPAISFSLGIAFASCLRLLCHWISGTLFFGTYAEWYFTQDGMNMGGWVMGNFSGWGLSMIYSAVYNLSYMLPETLIAIICGFLLLRFAGKQLLGEEIGKR